MAGKRPAGWVAGDVISTPGDPNRGKWLNVWGSAYRYPVLHPTREAAAAVTGLRGACVAHVTEYPMPGAAIGQCYRITAGTLGNRTDPGAPPVDYEGRPVDTCGRYVTPTTQHRAQVARGREILITGGQFMYPVVNCPACGYTLPGTWQAAVHCAACAKLRPAEPVPVMGEVLMTQREYSAAVGQFAASLAAYDTTGNVPAGQCETPASDYYAGLPAI